MPFLVHILATARCKDCPKLAYDAKTMTFPDFPEANQWVRTEFRDGWQVKGLSESS